MTRGPLFPVGKDPVDRWILRHAPLTVLAVVASGLALRIVATRGTYLGSDEAIHYQLVNVSSVADVYRATLTSAHPPLFFFLLHFWRSIDSSEFFLRLLPALLGTAMLLTAFTWANRLLKTSAAFFVLTLLAFSPRLIAISSEVRGYALLLFLMTTALAVLELAVDARSPVTMVAFSVLLGLTILTHYSAVWFALVAFTYVLFRFQRERPPHRLVAAWVGGQVWISALCLFLYRSHLAGLRGSHLERAVMNRAEYFYPSQEGALEYLARQTLAFFRSLMGSSFAAIVGLLAFLIAVGLLSVLKRPVALLFALPFLVGAAAGLGGVYFFGGTRHSSYLLLFAAGAIGFAGAEIFRGRVWPALCLGVILVWSSASSRLDSEGRDIAHMKAAVNVVRSNVAPDDVVFGDRHSILILSYYLDGGDYFRENPLRLPFWRSSAGGYRLVGSYTWAFNPPRLVSEFERLSEVHRLPTGQVVWVFHVGPEIDPARVLAERYPEAAVGRRFRFGEIRVVEARIAGSGASAMAPHGLESGLFRVIVRPSPAAPEDAQRTVQRRRP